MVPVTDPPAQRALRLPLIWRRSLIVIVGGSAFAASFIFLTDLALATGWPWPVALLLPLSIDALGAFALTDYRARRDPTAAAVAFLAIAGSALGNAASHWYATGSYDLAVTVVGAVPAVSLGIIVHLATKGSAWSTSSAPAQAEADPRPDPAQAGPTVDAGPATPSASSSGTPARKSRSAPDAARRASPSSRPPKRTDADLLALIRANGWAQLPGIQLAQRLNVRTSRGHELRRLLDQPSPLDPPPSDSPSSPGSVPSTNGGPASGSGTLTEVR
jgi:hypothetical protein